MFWAWTDFLYCTTGGKDLQFHLKKIGAAQKEPLGGPLGLVSDSVLRNELT
jgi:hypothetical protein